jgi:biotin synthase
MPSMLQKITRKILDGGAISFDEAVSIVQTADLAELLDAADKIRNHFTGNKIDLCTIMNAKSGRCSENCKFCAQSGHYATRVAEYPLVNVEQALALAKENEAEGVHRFGLVTSGKVISADDVDKIVAILKVLKQETNLKLDASLGCITYEQAVRLKAAGLSRYHHNVETSSDYYDKICDTHTYQDRIATIKNVSRAGLEVCCGGIIGMGEDMTQRIQMAFEIKALGEISSIPLNILNPIPGTPLANNQKLPPEEILRSIAMFRFVLPEAAIRYAGGRSILGEFQKTGFQAGINAMLVGNYLTTTGNKIAEDLVMLRNLGYEV